MIGGSLDAVRNLDKAGGFEEGLHLAFGVVESEAFTWKLLLRHARHVLAELIAERNPSGGSNAFANRRQRLFGIAPEVQDVIGSYPVKRREVARIGNIAVHQCQSTGRHRDTIPSSGLPKHFTGTVDAPHLRV